MERRLAAEADDLERFAARHRLAVGSPVSADGNDDFSNGEAAVNGYAARELDAAAAALRLAFERPEPAVVFERLADLAIAVTDLADPFQVVGLDRPEPPGARAAFSDLIVGSLPAALEAREGVAVSDPFAAAVALAEESAASRGAIEQVFAEGDPTRLDAMRRERLEAALSLARAVAFQTWNTAGQPPLDPAYGSHAVRIWPNPVRAEATMSFKLPTGGEATVELFDLAGRRVWSKALGSLAQGPHSTTLPGATMEALPPGIYVARIVAPRHVAFGRLAHVSR